MKIDSKKLKEELKWTIIDFRHNQHMQVEIKEGKFIDNEYVKKKDDTKCYMCDVLNKLSKQITKDIEEFEIKGEVKRGRRRIPHKCASCDCQLYLDNRVYIERKNNYKYLCKNCFKENMKWKK